MRWSALSLCSPLSAAFLVGEGEKNRSGDAKKNIMISRAAEMRRSARVEKCAHVGSLKHKEKPRGKELRVGVEKLHNTYFKPQKTNTECIQQPSSAAHLLAKAVKRKLAS
jgi:hypothetical protein